MSLKISGGMLIVFEGGEGSGKTTQIQFAEEYLHVLGHEVLRLREPGNTALGEHLRNLLLNGENTPVPMAEMLMYFTARCQLLDQIIRPALKENKLILMDRFYASTYAYQGVGRGLIGLKSFMNLLSVLKITEVPDLTIYLDLEPETGLKRAGKRSAKDRIEREAIDFHNRLRQGFKQFGKTYHPEKWVEIDASPSVEEVRGHVRSEINKLLATK